MAEHPSEGSRRRQYQSPRARRRAVVGLVVAFIFVAVMTGLFYQTTQSGLAPESGVVHLAGLTAPVTVIRDTAGVPHIYAQNRLDLARALGYTQAQDRLFQLEMRRRLAEGRLAEVFGADLVESDYVYRLFDPEKFARDSVATYPPEMRAQVDAFVDGINAYIDGHQNSLEPAFRLLGIKPAHFTAEDLEAGALTIATLLGFNATEESVYINLAPKMAPSEIAALMPVYPSLPLEAPPPETTAVFGGAKLSDYLPSGFALAPGFARIGHMGIPASNNWVVDGTKSMSGKPMLASDPHLPQSIPSIWYEAVLVTRGGFPGSRDRHQRACRVGRDERVRGCDGSQPRASLGRRQKLRVPGKMASIGAARHDDSRQRRERRDADDPLDAARTDRQRRACAPGQSAERRQAAGKLRAVHPICGTDSRTVGSVGIRLGHRAHGKGAGRSLSHLHDDAAQSRLGRRFGKYRMAYRWRDTESHRLRWQIPDRGIHGKFRMERNDSVRQFAAYRESADAFHRHCEQSPGRRTLEWKLG